PCPDSAASLEYVEAIAEIWGFSETERSPEQRRLGVERKLDRMRTLLSLLATPQASFRTILVAGTKGKGSIAAILASILRAAGYRVGRYTQPHLYSYRERIWVDGDYISQEALIEQVNAMRPSLDLMR